MVTILTRLCAAIGILAGLFFAPGPAHGAGDGTAGEATLYFFWGEGCSHCARAKPFLHELQRKHPALRIRSYEVFSVPKNMELLVAMAKERGVEASGVPTFIVGNQVIAGFTDEKRSAIERLVSPLPPPRTAETQAAAKASAITLPGIGAIDPQTLSLPAFTLIIALLDSFNPCAFFVLLFLLSLLIHAHSRRRMAIVGLTFVFFSGLVYFLFMAAWLNLFLVAGTLNAVTIAAGIIALIVAAINIKDFFFFEKGISLVIPEAKKPKLFERMRNLVRTGSLPSMLAGTVVLAVAANSYELLCTAGFPMVYTRILTLRGLAPTGYYLYLTAYNLVYVVPLAVIVGVFTATLGNRKLTEWEGRVLKLLSGVMMLMLGLVILLKPTLLNNTLVSLALLAAALLVTGIVALAARRFGQKEEKPHPQ